MKPVTIPNDAEQRARTARAAAAREWNLTATDPGRRLLHHKLALMHDEVARQLEVQAARQKAK